MGSLAANRFCILNFWRNLWGKLCGNGRNLNISRPLCGIFCLAPRLLRREVANYGKAMAFAFSAGVHVKRFCHEKARYFHHKASPFLTHSILVCFCVSTMGGANAGRTGRRLPIHAPWRVALKWKAAGRVFGLFQLPGNICKRCRRDAGEFRESLLGETANRPELLQSRQKTP
jgi:hypothetical protein